MKRRLFDRLFRRSRAEAKKAGASITPVLKPTLTLRRSLPFHGGLQPEVLLRDCHHLALSAANSGTLDQARNFARLIVVMTKAYAKIQSP